MSHKEQLTGKKTTHKNKQLGHHRIREATTRCMATDASGVV